MYEKMSFRRRLLLETIRRLVNYIWPDCEETEEMIVYDDGELYFIWHNLCPDTGKMSEDELLELLGNLTKYELV